MGWSDPAPTEVRISHSCPKPAETALRCHAGSPAARLSKPAWLRPIVVVRHRVSTPSARLPMPGVVGSSPIVRFTERHARTSEAATMG